MGHFIPGSTYFAFSPEEWAYLYDYLEPYIQNGYESYTDSDNNTYYLVGFDDLWDDKDNMDIVLYAFNVAVFNDSVQASIKAPGEW